LKFIERAQDNTLIIFGFQMILEKLLGNYIIQKHNTSNSIKLSWHPLANYSKKLLNEPKEKKPCRVAGHFSDGGLQFSTSIDRMEGKETFFFETLKKFGTAHVVLCR